MKKILKFGKKGCAPCEQVEALLKKRQVEYESVDPFETDDFEMVLKYDIKTVPVTFLLDEEGNILQRKNGFNEKALNFLIDSYNE